MAWPSLLIDRALAWRSSPSASKASSSKKNRVLSPEVRKYSSLWRVCSLVVKIDFTPSSGSKSSTSASARRFRSAHAASDTKSGSTRYPSRS